MTRTHLNHSTTAKQTTQRFDPTAAALPEEQGTRDRSHFEEGVHLPARRKRRRADGGEEKANTQGIKPATLNKKRENKNPLRIRSSCQHTRRRFLF